MKKIILSVAIIAAMVITTNVQKAHATQEQPSISMILEDDGFVDVELKDLSEVVQTAIAAFTEEFDINGLQFNAEKQQTKVKLTKKEDQSTKTVYLDAEGKEVAEPVKSEEAEAIEEQAPTADLMTVMQDNGFVNVKYDELNKKVQDAIIAIAEKNDVTSLRYNKELKITEVTANSKEDQTEKIVYLNDEGKEVEKPAAQEEITETPML